MSIKKKWNQNNIIYFKYIYLLKKFRRTQFCEYLEDVLMIVDILWTSFRTVWDNVYGIIAHNYRINIKYGRRLKYNNTLKWENEMQ